MHQANFYITLTIFVIALIAVDLYVFKGLRLLTAGIERVGLRTGIHIGYWSITAILVGWMALGIFGNFGRTNFQFFFMLVGAIILTLVPKLVFVVFHLLEDIISLGRSVFSPEPAGAAGEQISRLTFLSQAGAALALIPLVGIGYGIAKGRFDFRVMREKLTFKNLPKQFDGLKIVQLSDMHIGSFFGNHAAVQKGIEMVNALEPDIILFTGDMVNDRASELDGWLPVLSQLKAKMGKYSVLGNHDYGDYAQWNSLDEKQKNMEQLIDYQRKMGFDLLLDENRVIEKDGATFSLLGIQNWGTGGFAKYGKLDKAMQGSSDQGFQLLMSHDPSHWDAQVLGKTNIDLALAGHTHGSQFGVKIANWKWSPVQYRYKRWGGLYTEGAQHLYVNRGFGYIGFPGRVGMAPEITLLELHSA